MRTLSAFVRTAAVALLLAPPAVAQCPDGGPKSSCRREPTARALDNDGIAIVPFRTSGAEKSLGYLRYGLVDFLAAELSGDVGPRAVEPGETQRAWERAKMGDEPATTLQPEASREARVCGMVAEAIGMSLPRGANNAPLLVADSIMRFKTWHTPTLNSNPHWNYDLALAFARRREYRSAALAAGRRLFARRIRLTVSVRDEGRGFLVAGDTARAINAFQNYLKLRDDPEPALIPERDGIRAQLAAIMPRTKRATSKP